MGYRDVTDVRPTQLTVTGYESKGAGSGGQMLHQFPAWCLGGGGRHLWSRSHPEQRKVDESGGVWLGLSLA